MDKENDFTDEELDAYYIPDNYKKRDRKRNILEGIVVIGILCFIILHTPFVFNIKITAVVMIVVTLGTLFFFGIKDESVGQFVSAYIRHLKNRAKYIYRIPEKPMEKVTIREKIKSIGSTKKAEKEKTEDEANDENAGKKEKEILKYVQDILPIKNIANGIIQTLDDRYVHICEIMPVNFALRTNTERNAIIDEFYSWLKQAPARLHFKSITQPMDATDLIKHIKEGEDCENSEKIKEEQEDYIQHIRTVSQGDSLTRRFFFIIEYQGDLDGNNYTNNYDEIKKTIYQTRFMMESFFSKMENIIYEHNNESVFQAEVLYMFLNRNSSKTETFQERMNRVLSDHMAVRGLDTMFDDAPEDIDVRDYFAPRGIDTNAANYNIIDGLYYTYLYITDDGYPKKVPAGWLKEIVQSGDGVDVDIFLQKQNRNRILDSVKRAVRFASVDAKQKMDSEDAEEYIERIGTGEFIKTLMRDNREDFYYGCVLITIIAPTLKKLHEKKSMLVSNLRGKDIVVSDLFARCEDAFLMTLPLNYIDLTIFNKCKRNFLTSSVASLYMFTAFECYDEHGFLAGINTLNSSLACIDNFNTRKYKNANIVIFGTSGAGKTFIEQVIGRRLRLMGIRVLYILPIKAHEYYRGCKALDGVFIKVAPNSNDCINIMEIRVIDDVDTTLIDGETFSKECLLTKKINQIKIFIQLLLKEEKMTNIEESLLDEILTKIYNHYGITKDNDSIWEDKEKGILKTMPVIQDLYEEMLNENNLLRIRTILIPFINGSCSNMNGHTNVDLKNKYLVFDVSEAGDTYMAAFMFIALDCAYDIIKENRMRNDAIFIDECWKLLIDSRSAKYIIEIVKIIRGYGGASIIATQELEDFFRYGDGQYGKSIINNSKIKFVLQLEDEEADRMQKLLKLTTSEKKMIKKFTKGECLMITNDDKIPIYFRASEREEENFTTDPKRLAYLLEKKKKQSA